MLAPVVPGSEEALVMAGRVISAHAEAAAPAVVEYRARPAGEYGRELNLDDSELARRCFGGR